MATRTVTYPECDRAGCRRRKGVKEVHVSLEVVGDDNLYGDPEQQEGELCPAHVAMVKRFMDNLFKNTKEYPDGTD